MKITPAVTREEWMHRVAAELMPVFEAAGYNAKPAMKFSCGFTSKGGRSTTIGECHSDKASAANVHEIFIVPGLSEPVQVIATLAHEIAHAVVGLKHKHGAEFKKIATKIGLKGKMTATVAGPEFAAKAEQIMKAVGPYPHATLGLVKKDGGSNGPKQKTKMLKVTCKACEYTLRTTRKWLDIAVPRCPNRKCKFVGQEMEAPPPAEPEEGDE